MSLVDSLKRDIGGYAGLVSDDLSDLEYALGSLVDAGTPNVYLDEVALHGGLLEHGVHEGDALKVLLMTHVSGFKELVTNDGESTQAAIDRFVRNAVEQTGLNRSEVMRITRAIALSVGIACDITHSGPPESVVGNETAFVVPESLYKAELDSFEIFFEQAKRKGELGTLELSALEPLVAAGIPRAKYYMGACLMGLEEEIGANEKGESLLLEAANAGSLQASAELADYYFEKGADSWEDAYKYYTGFGALALSPEQKGNLETIMEYRKQVKRSLLICVALAVLMLLSLLFSSVTPSYNPHLVFGAACLAINIIGVSLLFLHYRSNPHDNASVLVAPALMMAVWAVYFALRILI